MSLSNIEIRAAILSQSPWRLMWRRLRRDPAALISIMVILLLIALALAAPLIEQLTGHLADTPNIETGTDINGLPLSPGTAGYLLGTDNVGRDILVRIAYGARISLFVGVVSTVIAASLGVVVGIVAGYRGGWLDSLLSRTMDVILSFPFVLFAIALISVYGASVLVTVLVIVFFSWAAIGRIVRGQALTQREKEYVEAARALGASAWRIMFVDILPNVLAPVIVLSTLLIPTAIVLEATLSYLGLGVEPPAASWGNMLSDAQVFGLDAAWWFWLFPSVALLATTLAFNILGDSVRDAMDPRTERIFAARAR